MAFDINKIYNKKWYKKKHVWLYVAAACMAIAAILVLVLGVANVNGWQRANGILHIPETGEVSVEFSTLDGTMHIEPLPESNLAWNEGNEVGVRYKVADPGKVRTYSTDVTLGICLFISAAMTTILAVTFMSDDKKRYKVLLAVAEKGEPVRCEIVSVFRDTTAMLHKKESYRLECAYTTDGTEGEDKQLNVFLSERFINKQGDFGGHVTTYVDPQNADNYYVDLSTLEIVEKHESAPEVAEI